MILGKWVSSKIYDLFICTISSDYFSYSLKLILLDVLWIAINNFSNYKLI